MAGEPWESIPYMLGNISTDNIILELEKRARESPGQWTNRQCLRIEELSKKLNPEPINR